MTFAPADLLHLDALLGRARAVVALRDVHAGNHRPDVVALRHDIDDNQGSFQTALALARWEARRGYRSTYFVLHTAGYWAEEPFFRAGLEELALAGHEVGIHVNALAAALTTGGDPHDILADALDELRDWGHPIIGAASHGDRVCYDAGFVNYEQFLEGTVEGQDPNRLLSHGGRTVRLEPLPLAFFGLRYEAYHLPRGAYLSDTGGQWSAPLEHDFDGQLQLLQHPDWWGQALRHPVAA